MTPEVRARLQPSRLWQTTTGKAAVFSYDRVYRYALSRRLKNGTGRAVLFIGLNPSTADEQHDDPTIRRETDFATQLGGHWLIKVNLFAWRSPKPETLPRVDDPIGPDNDLWVQTMIQDCGVVVAAWGAGGSRQVREMIENRITALYHAFDSRAIFCCGVTSDGAPRHPLYLPKKIQLQQFIHI